jgi:hypothetical protein
MRPKNQNNLSEDGAGFLPLNPSSRVRPSTAFRPANCPNIWRTEPRKKNTLSIFKKKLTPAKSEMQGVFFLSRLPSEMRRWGEFLAAAGGEMRSD